MTYGFLWPIFGHFIGDWSLQPEWVATNKGKYRFLMAAHCMVWTGCVAMGLEYLGILCWWKLLFLFVGHWTTDTYKCRAYAKVPFCQQKTYKHMYIDQGLHLVQCLIVTFG